MIAIAKQTRIEAVQTLLEHHTPDDLARRFTPGMEFQVLAFRPGYAMRVPNDAKSDPKENGESVMDFDLDAHYDRVGITGWNYRLRESVGVGFDLDSHLNHTGGVNSTELESAVERLRAVPYLEIRRSKSGKGYHVWVWFGANRPKTANHTEHAKLAKAILAQISIDAKFDFPNVVDVLGGNMWICARELGPDGLTLVHAAKETLNEWPQDFLTPPPPCQSANLDTAHEKLIVWLTTRGLGEWDAQNRRLNTHTAALASAHTELKLAGTFQSIATGSDGPADRNAFSYPRPDGAWFVCRHSTGATEHETLRKSTNGWTCCDYNLKKQSTGDAAQEMIRLAQEAGDSFFHSPEKLGFVETERHGHRETLLVREEAYANLLRIRFTDATGTVAKRHAVNNAIDQLEAHAVEVAPECNVHVRVASHDGKVYVDLGDTDRTIIEIDGDGWQHVEKAPIRFRRTTCMLPLPTPERGGSIDLLRPYVNVANDDWPLFVGALVMMLNPHGPYPLMALVGRGGSAKSTTARAVQELIDSTILVGSAETDSTEDCMILAQHRWLISFDNLTAISQSLSDTLCRLSTGGAFTRRTKYSDAGQSIFRAKRPTILTSIDDVVNAPDLLERTVRFELPPLGDRKTEHELRTGFEAIRGRVLGVLLDGVASALRNLPATKIIDLPRMADFALWATAAESGLGLNPGEFMASYRLNRREVNQLVLDDALPKALIQNVGMSFCGTATELAELIGWSSTPKDVRQLAGRIRLISPSLEDVGLTVSFVRRQGKRLIEIENRNPVPVVPISAGVSPTSNNPLSLT